MINGIAKRAIREWMVEHNLGTNPYFINANDQLPGLVGVLYYRFGAFRNLFDPKYGGGSGHLLKDFDEEVLSPINLHMERLGPYEIGLFVGRESSRRIGSR